jgi:hypothetical protein
MIARLEGGGKNLPRRTVKAERQLIFGAVTSIMPPDSRRQKAA